MEPALWVLEAQQYLPPLPAPPNGAANNVLETIAARCVADEDAMVEAMCQKLPRQIDPATAQELLRQYRVRAERFVRQQLPHLCHDTLAALRTM